MTVQKLIDNLNNIPESLKSEQLNVNVSNKEGKWSIGVFNKERDLMFGIIGYPDGSYYIGEYKYA